ncbi:MAG: DUF2723 domain-containing protein, partial [Chloroflexi bacterium]|nr:DUF2723 domain-containing protein [Chloroflexota bacterium]
MDFFRNKRLEIGDWRLRKLPNLQSLISNLILLFIPIIYLATLAQTPVLGDPTEFTFVSYIMGIAHPPGYALMTVLGKLIQTLVPVGTIAWRSHLLSAVAGTLTSLFVFGSVHTSTQNLAGLQPKVAQNLRGLSLIAGLFAALSVATAVNHWQHSIHTNPHIITGTFLVANLYFLTKWWASGNNKWLYIFSFSAGLGITHHPLTVFGFVGYAVFIVAVRPSILRDWKTLLKLVLMALLGLTVWLYFPIRSPLNPALGPTSMNTLTGFLDHILARGLTESLPFYTLADQPQRQIIFTALLRLQYSLPTILLALFGLVWLLFGKVQVASMQVTSSPHHPTPHHSITPSPRHLIILYMLPALITYVFVISLRQQDIMAYLIGPFAVIGLWAGLGLFGLLTGVQTVSLRRSQLATLLLAIFFFLTGPIYQFSQNAPLISLRHYREGQDYTEAVFNWFEGQNEGAVLLNDWEHMTPL